MSWFSTIELEPGEDFRAFRERARQQEREYWRRRNEETEWDARREEAELRPWIGMAERGVL